MGVIRVRCPRCKSVISANEDYAGMQETCPKCSTTVILPRWVKPDAKETAETPIEVVELPPMERMADDLEGIRSRLGWLCLLAGVIIVLLLFVLNQEWTIRVRN